MSDASSIRGYLDLFGGKTTTKKELTESSDRLKAKGDADLGEDQLDEDLGNLKQIDPEFQSVFKSYMRGPIKGNAGENSPIEVESIKNGTHAMKMLEAPNVIGAVFEINGVQVMSMSQDKDKYGRGGGYSSEISEKKLKSVFDDIDVSWDGKLQKATITSSGGANRAAIVYLLKTAKANGGEVTAKIIKADPERAAKQKERKASREGAIAMMDPRKLRQSMAYALRDKLEAFKASKATSVADFDQVADAFKDEFLDTITVADASYALSGERLNWESLNGKDSNGWHESYLEYSLTKDAESARGEAWMEWRRANRDASEEDYNKAKKSFPPRKFKVHLKLDGRSLAIDKIIPDYDYF